MKKLIFILIATLFIACSNEPINSPGKLSDANLNLPPLAMQASITNYDTGVSEWEGLYLDWLKDRLYEDGVTYIVTLESYTHEIYYGKFIVTYHD